MADMFGSPIGGRLAEQDILSAQESLGRIAVQPYEQRLKAAQAEEAELSLAAQRRFAEAAANLSAGGGTPGATGGSGLASSATGASGVASYLDTLAITAAQAGMPDTAGKLAGQSSLIRSREAATQNSAANRRLHELDSDIKLAEITGRIVNTDTVKDEASWQRALAALPQAVAKQFEGVPYSPELVKTVQRHALSQKDAMAEERQRLAEKRREETDRARRDELRTRSSLHDAQKKLAEARTRYLEGSGVQPPKASKVKVATDLMVQDFLMDPEEARTKGIPIVERAEEIVRAVPGLTFQQAVQRAYTEAQASGEFESFMPKPKAKVTKPDQKALAESYGQTYDPDYEYREQNGALQRRRRK